MFLATVTPSFGAALSSGRNAAAVVSMFSRIADPHWGPTVASTCCTSRGRRETWACTGTANSGRSTTAAHARWIGCMEFLPRLLVARPIEDSRRRTPSTSRSCPPASAAIGLVQRRDGQLELLQRAGNRFRAQVRRATIHEQELALDHGDGEHGELGDVGAVLALELLQQRDVAPGRLLAEESGEPLVVHLHLPDGFLHPRLGVALHVGEAAA